ncbi:MAG: PEP/pyruvate-binding domain-containing protein [Candidatus Aenigmatarchaeota archaeon]
MKEIIPLSEADDIDQAGSKAASLAKMQDKFHVPGGFVITNEAYRKFLEDNGIKSKVLSIIARTDIENEEELYQASQRIKRIFNEVIVPTSLKEKIEEAYKDLVVSSEAKKAGGRALELIKAGREEPSVVLRASVKRKGNSFAGVYDTKLNIKGVDNLVQEVKKIWQSYFSPRAIYYREKNGHAHDIPFAVIIQKMVEADKSANYLEISSEEGNRPVIEAVHGLGKILSDGEITPDVYLFDGFSNTPEEKKIAKKEWIQTKNPSTDKVEKQPISSGKKNSEVLERKEINEIMQSANKIKSYFNFSPVIEFCLRNEEVLLVDVAPNTISSRNRDTEQGTPILEGLGVSPGQTSGTVARNGNVSQGDIAVIKNLTLEKIYYGKPAGVISDQGGFSSNLARIAREFEIPTVSGTGSASSKLNDGDRIRLNGSEGRVVRKGNKHGRQQTEDLEVPSLGELEEPTEPVNHEKPDSGMPTATEILISVDLDRGSEKLKQASGGIVEVEESLSEDSFGYNRGGTERKLEEMLNKTNSELWVRCESKNSLEKISRIVEEAGSRSKKKANILLSSVRSPEELKTVLASFSLPRNAMKGVVIETPIMALSIAEICKEDLDMILIDFDEVTKLLFGYERDEKQVLSTEALWNIVEEISDRCKERGIEVCATGTFNKRMMKKLIKYGIDSISVSPGNYQQAKNIVARAEKKLLLEKVRRS